jgi:oligoribonuclease NrnB/cAMP/cGMP phosphodiesterase (DHH superfamily)
MSEKKSICLVHADIDGAASYCVLCWYKNKRIPVKALSQSDFITFWKNSILKNIELFERIYVFDLNVGEHFELFDFSNVTIVDHHQESIANKLQYKRAKVFCEDSKSTATLLYRSLKQYKNEEFLTPERKLLLLAASDYDSYTFDLPFSKDLNYLFWSYQGDRVAKFYEEFNTGYRGFNDFQKNIISFYKKRLKETTDSLQIYYGEYNVGGKKYMIFSTFADFGINDVADFVLSTYKADICIVVNLKTNRVSFRKTKGCPVKLNQLANILSQGGGHEDAAGGILNDTFINFSKSLKLYEYTQHSS